MIPSCARHRRLVAIGEVTMFALLTSGCATAINGTTQKVDITSNPPGASALLLPQGTTVTTPARVELSRKKVYTVIFSREGYRTQCGYLDKQISPVLSGNLLVGGLVGIATDADSGAAWDLIPNPLHAELAPLAVPHEDVEIPVTPAVGTSAP